MPTLPHYKDSGKRVLYREYYYTVDGEIDFDLVNHVGKVYNREVKFFGYKF